MRATPKLEGPTGISFRGLVLVVWSLVLGATQASGQEGIRITTESLAVRSGPDAAYVQIGTVWEGQVYVVSDASGSYMKIWYNRNEGWVHSGLVAPRSTSYDEVFSGTNVRSGPSTSYPIIGYAVKGSRWAVFKTSSSGSWHQIFYEGQMAWFCAEGRATTKVHAAPNEPQSVAEPVALRPAAGDVTVRCGPGIGHDPIGAMLTGQGYFSTEIFEGWRKIWFSASQGWAPDAQVALRSAEYDTVDWESLNVRTGPGLEYEKVGSVCAGSKWVALEYSGSWHRIYFDSQARWISGVGVTTSDYVAPDGAPPSPTRSSIGFLKLPASGPGFVRRCGANNPDHAWGVPAAINGLLLAAESWQMDHPEGPRIRVGDISLPDGGPFDDNGSFHTTHQSGSGIDFFLLRLDGSEAGAPDIHDPAYSSSLTRDWIENYLTQALPEIRTHGILLCDPALFSRLTTVSERAVCPGEGCPLGSDGLHVPPGPEGIPYILCNPGHHDHFHTTTADP